MSECEYMCECTNVRVVVAVDAILVVVVAGVDDWLLARKQNKSLL